MHVRTYSRLLRYCGVPYTLAYNYPVLGPVSLQEPGTKPPFAVAGTPNLKVIDSMDTKAS